MLRALLGEGDYELEAIERWGGTRSPLGTPLWDAIATPGSRRPGRARPSFRSAPRPPTRAGSAKAFGTVMYGFFPMNVIDPELARRLIHSAGKQTHVDDLGLGVDFLRSAARSLLGC